LGLAGVVVTLDVVAPVEGEPKENIGLIAGVASGVVVGAV